MKEIKWKEAEKRLLKDPEVVIESSILEPEFQALRELIILRKSNKITQHKLAEKIKMRQSHIARLESGEVTPTLKVLKRYASGLGRIIALKVIPKEEYSGKRAYI